MSNESPTLSPEQLSALQGVITDIAELNDEERMRLLVIVARIMPSVKHPSVSTIVVMTEPMEHGYIGVSLASYNIDEVHVIATLEAAAEMARQHHSGAQTETLQ